jgi:GH25 family lysozyme M1 (1,4-beta-N-acetylmuramidase)
MEFTISGIDVSHHQGECDFQAAYDSGQRFAIVKATEGRDYLDPRFAENWTKLLELDGKMGRGAYMFARPDSVGGAADGQAEAEDFCDVLKAVGGYDRGAGAPVIDYEKYSGQGTSANLQYIDACVKTIQDQLGRDPMIYTGDTIWGYQTGNSDAWTDLALWLVEYSRADYPTSAMENLKWDRFAMWQWSGGGDFAYAEPVPGIGQCDVNWWGGSQAEFEAFFRMEAGIPRPPDPRRLVQLLRRAEQQQVNALCCVRAARAMLEKVV